jgi:hypothetical protein
MTGLNRNYKFGRIRNWLREAVSRHIDPDARWLADHIAGCRRCQRRFISYGKVNLAISAIKSQPHRLDLLKCANAQTIGVLRHSLRRDPEAGKLKTMQPEPGRLQKYSRYSSSLVNLAACVTILVLMKFGLFSSVNMCQKQGQKVMEKYYANHIGDDLADEIFPKDTKITRMG